MMSNHPPVHPLRELHVARRRKARKLIESFELSGADTAIIRVDAGDLLTGYELHDYMQSVLAMGQMEFDLWAGIRCRYEEKTDNIYLYRNPNL